MKRILLPVLVTLFLLGCGEVPDLILAEPVIPETTVWETENSSESTEPEVTEPLSTLTEPEPADDEFVLIQDYIPDIRVELKYATADNFTGMVIYDFSEAYLRYGTVKKLQSVQAALAEQGLQLKIWDAFRPVSAQFDLWEAYPDPNYVANPTVGFSSHSRGNTVDVTITDLQGNELAMPTGFDDFSSMANRNYSDCGEEEAENARFLQELMEAHGFVGYFGEWWHFSDTQEYPVEKSLGCPEPSVRQPLQ